jgi:hypothetical protein
LAGQKDRAGRIWEEETIRFDLALRSPSVKEPLGPPRVALSWTLKPSKSRI